MNIVLVLIPLSLVLVALGVWAFFWSVDHAQFDDLDTPALIPLSDDVALVQPAVPATAAGPDRDGTAPRAASGAATAAIAPRGERPAAP